MKKILTLALGFALMLCGTAFAAAPAPRPASPFPVSVAQPDGTAIEIFNRGDEKCHWVETPDGYSLAKNESTGWWEYAQLDIRTESVDAKKRYRLVLVPSGIAYRPPAAPPEGWPKGLRPTL